MDPVEQPALLELWERSVRATHAFLDEADIAFYRPLVNEYLLGASARIWVLADAANAPIGFLGLGDHSIDALFLDPSHRGHGFGRRLVAHAQDGQGGALTVEVNEQNSAARGFYEALGFVVVGRSPLDDTGRPFPLLRMRREPQSR